MVRLLVNIDDEGMAQLARRSIDPANITKEELAHVLSLPKQGMVTAKGLSQGETLILRGVGKPAAKRSVFGAAVREQQVKAVGGVDAMLRHMAMAGMTWTAKSAVRKMERTKARQDFARGDIVQIGTAAAVKPSDAAVDVGLADRQAKRRSALMKMRELWNQSNAGADEVDGVEYQKAMRSEW